jgi:hypothetical protein
MEFAILQLERQVDELLAIVQYALSGKLLVTLVSPATLREILCNVSLRLPENHKLVVGTRWENIHLYYDLIKVALICDVHSIKLVMDIPMRTADQSFNLYKLIAMPAQLDGDTFIKYDPEHLYFRLSVSQRDCVAKGREPRTVHPGQHTDLQDKRTFVRCTNPQLREQFIFPEQ